MARVIPQVAKWQIPTDTTITSHRLYVVPATDTLDYSSPFVDVSMPDVSYSLPGTFSMGIEQDYKLGLSALDSVGNESDIVEITRFFDFNPPAAPVGFVVVAG